jgi:hypothetical protein
MGGAGGRRRARGVDRVLEEKTARTRREESPEATTMVVDGRWTAAGRVDQG